MNYKQMKKLRIEKGLTQRALGKLAGVAGGSISRYENGLRVIPSGTRKRIKAVLLNEAPLFESDIPDFEIEPPAEKGNNNALIVFAVVAVGLGLIMLMR